MRMRKKKWAEPYINSHPEKAILNHDQYKGSWQKLFNKDEIHLEIGTGKGEYISSMSKLYPNTAWIGIEKETNVCAVCLKKVVEQDLNNVKIMNADANLINDYFASKEIDVIHLNFSDPWPKNSHSKRRLSSKVFLDRYYDILKDDGHIIMKTDNKQLFEFSIIEISNHKFKIKDFWVDFRREEHLEDTITEYEQKFMDLKQPIYRVIFKKVV